MVIFENHDYAEIVDAPNATTSKAPYFNSLIKKYGLATNYMDSGAHPSLPNYLTLASGDVQYTSLGFLEPDPNQPPFPVKQPNLGTQLQTANIKWRSYQESIGTPCRLSASSNGDFVPRHNPFPYFDDIQKGANNLCADTNVDYSQFATDLAAGTYKFNWITPNITDDGHDPQNDPVKGLAQSDSWAHAEIDKIMASNAYKNGGVIFITWDEAEGRNSDSKDQVPMIIVSELIKSPGYQSAKPYSHKSWLATVEDLLGLPRLAKVTGEASMTEFFK
jgi:phospholipase C